MPDSRVIGRTDHHFSGFVNDNSSGGHEERYSANGGVVMTIFGTANVDFLNRQSGILVDENATTVPQVLNKCVSPIATILD